MDEASCVGVIEHTMPTAAFAWQDCLSAVCGTLCTLWLGFGGWVPVGVFLVPLVEHMLRADARQAWRVWCYWGRVMAVELCHTHGCMCLVLMHARHGRCSGYPRGGGHGPSSCAVMHKCWCCRNTPRSRWVVCFWRLWRGKCSVLMHTAPCSCTPGMCGVALCGEGGGMAHELCGPCTCACAPCSCTPGIDSVFL
jgi:hypothetical protein